MIYAVDINLPLKRMSLFSTSNETGTSLHFCVSRCGRRVAQGRRTGRKAKCQFLSFVRAHFVPQYTLCIYTFMHTIDYVLACTNHI